MATSNQQKEARVMEFSNAAKKLSDEQRKEAMESLLDTASEVEAGIIRQILAEPEIPLSQRQQTVFDRYIEPSMVEQCRLYSSCKGFTMPGVELCPSCDIKFG
jgi:hypothetical protein